MTHDGILPARIAPALRWLPRVFRNLGRGTGQPCDDAGRVCQACAGDSRVRRGRADQTGHEARWQRDRDDYEGKEHVDPGIHPAFIIAGLKIDEFSYDKAGTLVTGDTFRHRTPLQPGEIAEVTLRTPVSPRMDRKQYQFVHADGDRKTTVVPKL